MKRKLRKELIEKRKNIPKNKVLEKSNKIKKILFEIDEFKQASTILFYVSYDNEVYTHDMIKESKKMGKRVVVPFSDKANRRLILSELDNWSSLKPGSYGILEPSKDEIKEFSIEKIDLIIVPGVGFDESGRRIGHGKGYYDNLLKKLKDSLIIGLAFELQIIDKIPVNKHDIPVKKIITENRLIDC
jgi:5-formyltetrahydrofolate cyclo-ligase